MYSELSEDIFIFSLQILPVSLAFCMNDTSPDIDLDVFHFYDYLHSLDFVQLFLCSECVNILIKVTDLIIFCFLFPSS